MKITPIHICFLCSITHDDVSFVFFAPLMTPSRMKKFSETPDSWPFIMVSSAFWHSALAAKANTPNVAAVLGFISCSLVFSQEEFFALPTTWWVGVTPIWQVPHLFNFPPQTSLNFTIDINDINHEGQADNWQNEVHHIDNHYIHCISTASNCGMVHHHTRLIST